MSREPVPNVHYDEVGEESLLWTIKWVFYPLDMESSNTFQDMWIRRPRSRSYASRWFCVLRCCHCSWCRQRRPQNCSRLAQLGKNCLSWVLPSHDCQVFVFDDQLDDGPLGVLEDDARKYIDCTLEMLERSNVNRDDVQPIQWALKDIWNRVQMVRSML